MVVWTRGARWVVRAVAGRTVVRRVTRTPVLCLTVGALFARGAIGAWGTGFTARARLTGCTRTVGFTARTRTVDFVARAGRAALADVRVTGADWTGREDAAPVVVLPVVVPAEVVPRDDVMGVAATGAEPG